MELRINNQKVNVLLCSDESLSAEEIKIFERFDHILRANPKFQARYPRACLESAAFDPDQKSKMRLSYTCKHGRVEFEGSLAFMTAIDFKHHTVMLAI